MGYIEIIDIDNEGVSVTDMSDANDIVRLEIMLAMINEMKGNK
jgi:hypothetical protein